MEDVLDSLDTSKYLTVEEVADLFRVGTATIQLWIRRGDRLPAPIRIGNRFLFEQAEIAQLIERSRVPSTGRRRAVQDQAHEKSPLGRASQGAKNLLAGGNRRAGNQGSRSTSVEEHHNPR